MKGRTLLPLWMCGEGYEQPTQVFSHFSFTNNCIFYLPFLMTNKSARYIAFKDPTKSQSQKVHFENFRFRIELNYHQITNLREAYLFVCITRSLFFQISFAKSQCRELYPPLKATQHLFSVYRQFHNCRPDIFPEAIPSEGTQQQATSLPRGCQFFKLRYFPSVGTDCVSRTQTPTHIPKVTVKVTQV